MSAPEFWGRGFLDSTAGGKKRFDPALLCCQMMSLALQSQEHHPGVGKRVGREEPLSLSGVYPGAFRLRSPVAKLPASYQPAAFITLSPHPPSLNLF